MKNDNRNTHYKEAIKDLIEIVKNYIDQLKKSLPKKTQKTEKEDSYDVSIDDVRNAYKKIPAKLAYMTAGGAFLIMIILALIITFQRTNSVDKERKVVEAPKDTHGEVEISIDEQGWKHYQSKRIDNVASSVKKQIESNKKEMKELSEDIKTTVSNELNSTLGSVKGFLDDMTTKMNTLRDGISVDMKETVSRVENKLKENEDKVVRLAKENQNGFNNIPSLDAQSTFLPPPLSALSTKNEVEPKKDNKEKEEIVVIEPDSDAYSYDNVELVEMSELEEIDIATSLYQEDENKTKEPPKYHIMKGLTNATLLTGIDAPTFGGSNSKDPAPVLFSVDGEMLIANTEYEVIDDCLVAGVATGNVNTSRADILLTELSCTAYTSEGKKVKIEQNIKGWAIGEDGSFGLQGRLLDSSGKVITKMIALEVIQGLTQAMVMASQPTNTATGLLGTSNNLSYGQSAQASLGSGVSKGLDHAYDHYNEILTGMYPTISVRAGKKVSLHLKGGEDVTPSYYNGLDINEDLEVAQGVEQ